MTPLLAWVGTRMRPGVFGPLVVILALAAYLTVPGPGAALLKPALAAGALLLVTQFRLWDDLEDRERDAVSHPERVLVRSPARSFRAALWILAIANLAIPAALEAWTALALVAGLDVAFVVAYRARSGLPDFAWRYAVLLSKYPAFVAVLAFAQRGDVSESRLAVAAVAIYTIVCVYEAFHDRPFRPGVKS